MNQEASPKHTDAPVTDKPQSLDLRGSDMATIENDDERLLNRIGYTQVNLLRASTQRDIH